MGSELRTCIGHPSWHLVIMNSTRSGEDVFSWPKNSTYESSTTQQHHIDIYNMHTTFTQLEIHLEQETIAVTLCTPLLPSKCMDHQYENCCRGGEFAPSIWADARSSYVRRSRLCSKSGLNLTIVCSMAVCLCPIAKSTSTSTALDGIVGAVKRRSTSQIFYNHGSIWLVYLRFTNSNNSTWGGGCERLCSWYGRVLFDTMTAIGDGSMLWWPMIFVFGCAPSSTSGEGMTLGLWKRVPQLLWTAKVDGNHVGFLGGHLNDNCNTPSRELGRPNFIEGAHHKM